MYKKIYDIVKDWVKECGGDGYRINVGAKFSFSKNILTIYTDRPGLLIGKAGCEVEKCRIRLQKALGIPRIEIEMFEFDAFITNAGAVKKSAEEFLKKLRDEEEIREVLK